MSSVLAGGAKMKELSEVSANAWSYPVPAMEISCDVWKDVIHKWEWVAQQAPPTTPRLSIQQIIRRTNATYFTQQFACFMDQLIITKNLPGNERRQADFHSHNSCLQWQVHTFALVISLAGCTDSHHPRLLLFSLPASITSSVSATFSAHALSSFRSSCYIHTQNQKASRTPK